MSVDPYFLNWLSASSKFSRFGVKITSFGTPCRIISVYGGFSLLSKLLSQKIFFERGAISRELTEATAHSHNNRALYDHLERQKNIIDRHGGIQILKAHLEIALGPDFSPAVYAKPSILRSP